MLHIKCHSHSEWGDEDGDEVQQDIAVGCECQHNFVGIPPQSPGRLTRRRSHVVNLDYKSIYSTKQFSDELFGIERRYENTRWAFVTYGRDPNAAWHVLRI